MASTKLYLDMRSKAKDGKGTVLVILSHNQSTTTFSTGVRVLPANWKNGKVVKLPDSGVLNIKIDSKKTSIDKALALLSLEDDFLSMTASDLKQHIDKKKPMRSESHLISDVFSEYMTMDLKEGTKEIYRTVLGKIHKFSGDKTKIDDIDLKWLHKFDSFMAQTQGVNGRSIYMRSLRAICKYAYNTRLISYQPFENFQIKSVPTKKRSVTVDLLREFRDCPTSKANAKYRDFFFLMFYFIGINAGDLFLARKDSVSGNRFEYIRRKTGRKYSIKIEPEAKKLLKKYEGQGDYLLNVMDHCKSYKNFLHEMNDALRMIGNTVVKEVTDEDNLFGTKYEKELIPIVPKISTQWARHTWATLARELDIPLDTVSQAMGHSFANKTTLIYVRFNQRKVDDANRMIIDYLNGSL